MESATLNNVTEKVITSLIDTVLNSPKFSWEKTWKNIASGNDPYNPTTKGVYRGFNRFILQLNASIKGCNQFATFNQIKGAGGTVIKGSKAIPLMFFCWKLFDPITKKTYDSNKINNLPANIQSRLKKFPFNSFFNVFSLSDCQDISFETPKIEIKNDPIAECQNLVNAWECKINVGLDNERAYYSPSSDHINMPHLQAFKDSNAFYMTAFHEIAHSTGAKERLNRDFGGMFGNDKYAKEELIAELSSVLVASKMDILNDDIIKNATAYLQSWTKRMIDKKAELFAGLSHAIKAYDYIINSVTPSI